MNFGGPFYNLFGTSKPDIQDDGVFVTSWGSVNTINFTGTGVTASYVSGVLTVAITSGGGSGTVTSVGWTGGIVSVATATTTPAFTIAGTSGGIPYFSSGSTWATSAALAANAIVIGGGAGAAPATTTTGTGVLTALGVNTGTAGAFVVNGGALGTPSSGTLTNATGLPIVAGTTGTLSVARGGTGVTAITALSIWAANSANTLTEITPGAGNSIRINAGGTAWEAYTPGSGGGPTAGINTTVSGTNVNALSDTINPSQITSWQNDYAPTNIGTTSVINLDADTSFPFITGITATGMSDGEIKIFNNDGSNPYGFKDSSTDSTAGNRFEMGEDVILLPKRNVAFRYDTTNTCWRLVGNSPDIPREYYSQDYYNGMWQKTNDGIFNWWTSGSGASNALNTLTAMQSSRPGVVTSSTGTTTSGYAQIFGNDAADPNKVMTVTKGYTEFNANVYFDNLSDGTDTYTYKMGLVNSYSSSTGASAEVIIGYSSGINSGKWFLRTQSASTTTDVDSGVTVAADTWYHIKWVCYDGDRVDFWINGTYGGSSSTNIPTATLGPIMSIWKTAGTTARTVDTDYWGFKAVNYTA